METRLTNDEILNKFPEHSLIKSSCLKETLEDIFLNSKTYHDIRTKVMDKCKEYYPEPKVDYDKNSEWSIWSDYFYGKYDDKFKRNDPLGDWIKLVENEFIERKGKLRTFDEACHLAADKWCAMMFDFHLQDNGALNEDHAGGFWACALATVLKNDSMKEITEDMIKEVNKHFYTYYSQECWYYDKEKDEFIGIIEPYCDYDPNVALYTILEEAGIPKKHIRSLCPWKTGIEIDKKDNSVIIKGYQKRQYE